jgi:tetratricopeptide (TPR) repeat protein
VLNNRNVILLVAGLLSLLPAGAGAVTSGDLPDAEQAQLDAAANDQARYAILEGLVAARPGDPVVHFQIGNTLYDMGQLEPAIGSYRKAIELDDQLLGAHVNLGSALDELGRLDDALAAYESALALDPKDARTLCNIGGVYFQKRRMERALQYFQDALDVDPQSQLAHYNMAILFADAEIYREAVAEWEAAVAIDPDSDIGRRSADNILIIREMMAAEMPNIDGR